jgi:hypothetical protein
MLLVRPVQSFIAGLRGNIDAARQHMDLWAIERDVTMDGENVSSLVATAFLERANLNLGIADYHHLAAYFGGAIKQSYCTEFPIDETSGHSSTTAARQYANCSNDHRFMDSQQMYTYRLAAEAWHRLLQLDRSPVRNPPTGGSTDEVPVGVDQPDGGHCSSQPRISRVFGQIDRPPTDLAATARRSNARSTFSASPSSTRPRTVDVQGTGFGRDVGPGKHG